MTESACPFCKAIAEGKLLLDGGAVVAIADAYPISKGHALVVPRRHEADFFALSREEQSDMIALVNQVKRLLDARHQPQGYNLGVNAGVVAGQTMGHAHMHVVPRYEGDAPDPRGGVRWIIPGKAKYWAK